MSATFVILEERDGALTQLSLETLAAGKRLAETMQLPLHAVLLGDDLSSHNTQFAEINIARIHFVEHPLLKKYTADAFTLALEQLIRATQPAFVVLPHSYQVRDYAPRLAARFGQSLISDVVAIHDGPIFVRQLFQGKLNADYHALGSPAFVSIQAGAFRADAIGAAAIPPEISNFAPQLAAEQIRTNPSEKFREAAATVDLSAAEKIVSVGRGVGSAEKIAVIEELARALGAELAGSRPVCDNGWLPMERQVGSSGHTVAPKLYIAIGISGAIQHLVGMKGANTIVAINKDEHAPIFEVADYGIVGDLFDVVPALTAAVKAAKS